jgi:hypothetical protein
MTTQIKTSGCNNMEQIKGLALLGSSSMVVSSTFQDENNAL